MNEGLTQLAGWKYESPETEGFHTVVSPHNSPLKVASVFRLNLDAGSTYTLRRERLELNAVVIHGSVELRNASTTEPLGRLDSFYLPGGETVTLTAREAAFLYLGGAPCEGVGRFLVRRYEPDLPLGDIRQVHGRPPYQRDVFMTLNPEVKASRLICGLTWGEEGRWTSWPPHQHTAHLEEVYCYFDIPRPKFALHLGYTESGRPAGAMPVSSGDCMIAPEGYHPTVASPGVRSCYFWVLAAHSRASRRYDLAVSDPAYDA